jgi:hypothetical protein
MRELSATGFMSNRGRQVTFDTWPHKQHNCRGLNSAGHKFPIIHLYNCSLCRLSAHFLYEIWVLIGEWEQNGLKHVYWIMTQLQIMVTGHMEQVGPVFYYLLVPNVTKFWIEQYEQRNLFLWTGTDWHLIVVLWQELAMTQEKIDTSVSQSK